MRVTVRDRRIEQLAAEMYAANTKSPAWTSLPADGLTRHRYRKIARRLVDNGWTKGGDD